MANTQNTVTVASTATLVLAANTWRRGFNIYNTGGAQTIYIGFTSGVTTATGTPILVNASFTSDGMNNYKGDIYAITASSTSDARYLEWTM